MKILQKIKFKIVILFLLSNINSFAQKEDYNWTLYDNVRLDFNTIPLSVSVDISNVKFGMSCVSDKLSGNLLFYGDCNNIYDRNNTIIYSLPSSLKGNSRSIIVPQPQTDSVFFMFIHASDINLISHKFIKLKLKIAPSGTVYMIDSANMAQSYTDKFNFFLVVKHHNNTDYWLLLNGEQPNQINSYLITKDTISLQHTSVFSEDIIFTDRYVLKHSLDGRKIVYSEGNRLSFFNIDRNTGALSNLRHIDFGLMDLCFEFSPSSGKIFIAANKPIVIIKQYSFNEIDDEAAFLSTEQILPTTPYRITDLQLAPNGKIYASLLGKDSLGVIENTENVPPICSFKNDGVYLQGQIAGWHFPHFIRYHTSFSYELDCNTVNYTYYGNQPLSILWNFGDSQTSTELDPTHTYTNAGTYTVTLTVTYTDNTTKTISKQITIYNKPTQPTILHD